MEKLTKNWIITICGVCVHVLTLGNILNFGFLVPVFESTFAEDFENGTLIDSGMDRISLLQVDSIGSLQFGLFLGFQFLTAFTFDSKSWISESLMFIGLAFWFIGIFSATYAEDFGQLLVLNGVCLGIGSSLLFWTSFGAILSLTRANIGFEYYVSVAIGLGSIGHVLFIVIVAPYYSLEQSYWFSRPAQCWKVAFRITAIAGFGILLVSTLTLTYFKRFFYPEKIQGVNYKRFVKILCCNCRCEKNELPMTYWCLVVSVMLGNMAIMAPYFQLVEQLMQEESIDRLSTRSVMIALAGGTLIGQIIPILTTGRLLINTMYLFSELSNLVVILFWLLVSNYNSAILFSLFLGVTSGVKFTTVILFLQQLAYGGNKSSGLSISSLLLIPMTVFSLACASLGSSLIFSAVYEDQGYMMAIGLMVLFQATAVLFAVPVYFTTIGKDGMILAWN